MDVGKAIGFLFEDEDWIKKLLLASVLLLVPIFGWFVLFGYMITIVRNVMAGDERPLPEWSNIGDLFMEGLMFWVATLIYSLPVLVLMCPIFVVAVLPALAGENEDLMALLAGVSGIIAIGLTCLAFLYGLLMMLLMPVLQIRYAESGELGACLRFGEVFGFLSANFGSILISQLVLMAANFAVGVMLSVLSTILSLIPICGWILLVLLGLATLPIYVWVMIFPSHMYGQIGQQAGLVPTGRGVGV